MFGEPSVGIEPTTPSLPWKCSTTELRGRVEGLDRAMITALTGPLHRHGLYAGLDADPTRNSR